MALLLKDLLTGTNGTLLSAHTPDAGGAWISRPVEYSTANPYGTNYATTSFAIQSNQAAPNTSNVTADNHIGNLNNIGKGDDFVFIATLTTPATMNTARLAIAFRSNAATAIDTCDNWQFNIRPDLNDCRLRRIDDSVETVVAGPTGFTFATNTTYTLKVVVSDDNIRCYVNNTKIFDVSSATYAANTYVGIVKNTGDSAYRLDDIYVYDYPFTLSAVEAATSELTAAGVNAFALSASLAGTSTMTVEAELEEPAGQGQAAPPASGRAGGVRIPFFVDDRKYNTADNILDKLINS